MVALAEAAVVAGNSAEAAGRSYSSVEVEPVGSRCRIVVVEERRSCYKAAEEMALDMA